MNNNSISGVLEGVDYSSPLVKYRGEKVVRLLYALYGSDLVKIDPALAVDIYYTLYLPAPVPREDGPEVNKAMVSTLLTSPSGIKLRSKTILDGLMSGLASAILLGKIHEELSGVKNRQEDNQLTSSSTDRRIHEKIVEDTLREVSEVYQLRVLLEGSEPGSFSIESIEEYSLELIRLARQADIQLLLKSLSGISIPGYTRSTRKIRSRRGEKIGFEIGRDLERIATRELLVDEDLFLYRLLQGQLLLYSKYIEESSGPVYVLVDKSGSMEGEKIKWAKILILALLNKSLKEKREFYIRFFDSQPHGLRYLSKKPKMKDVTSLFEYIARMKNAGGTDISRALVTALRDLIEKRIQHASIVLVTDGIDRITERTLREALKKTSSRLITVMIKGDNESLKRISTIYLKAVELSQSEVIRVVKAID